MRYKIITEQKVKNQNPLHITIGSLKAYQFYNNPI